MSLTLSHRTHVLGPNCLAWPVLGQWCLFYMPNRHGKVGGYIVAKSGDNSIFHHEVFAHHQESSLNLSKPENVASFQVLPYHKEANRRTKSRWPQTPPLKATATGWWETDPLCSCNPDLGREAPSSCAALQLQRLSGSPGGLPWSKSHPHLGWNTTEQTSGHSSISLYLWRGIALVFIRTSLPGSFQSS